MPDPPPGGEAGHKLDYLQGSLAGPSSLVAQDGQEVA